MCVVFMSRQVDSGVGVVGRERLNSGCGHVVRAGDSWSAWLLVLCLFIYLVVCIHIHKTLGGH